MDVAQASISASIAHRCLKLFLRHTFVILVLTEDWRLSLEYPSVIQDLKGDHGFIGVHLCDFSAHRLLGMLLAYFSVIIVHTDN